MSVRSPYSVNILKHLAANEAKYFVFQFLRVLWKIKSLGAWEIHVNRFFSTESASLKLKSQVIPPYKLAEKLF